MYSHALTPLRVSAITIEGAWSGLSREDKAALYTRVHAIYLKKGEQALRTQADNGTLLGEGRDVLGPAHEISDVNLRRVMKGVMGAVIGGRLPCVIVCVCVIV